jgi:hypothetical protein
MSLFFNPRVFFTATTGFSSLSLSSALLFSAAPDTKVTELFFAYAPNIGR